MVTTWYAMKLRLRRGVQKLASLLWLQRGPQPDKLQPELYFQAKWTPLFERNIPRVLEYWRRHRYLDEILALIPPLAGRRVLDVGCGISTVLHFLEGERYGVDPLADEYLKIYKYPPGISVRKGEGESLPFPEEHFDLVFCTNALDHVTDVRRTLSEIRRVLRYGGSFVLTVETFQRPIHRDIAHPHSLTRADVFALLGEGLEVIFERASPWIGLENYVRNRPNPAGTTEIVIVARKPTPRAALETQITAAPGPPW